MSPQDFVPWVYTPNIIHKTMNMIDSTLVIVISEDTDDVKKEGLSR